MLKAIIFDLDSCLAAANEVGDQLFAPAFDAIRRANHGTVPQPLLEQALADCWRCSFDFVADKYGFTDAMGAAGWEVFKRTEVTDPMHGYPDLGVVKELPLQCFLVTSGFRRLQESKIKALGFAPWFTAIYVDAIDEPERQGKLRIFVDLLKAHGLQPNEVLVVGDNPDSEIEAGNRLGIETVQILRPGVPRSDSADRHIQSLSELQDQLRGQHN
jgi:FMN phosphatase YigB (HAD superfamily)